MESPSDPRWNPSTGADFDFAGESATSPTQDRDGRPRKKASTACTVCKKRKTKCSGEYPCDRCIQRGTVAECVIDTNADLRRRGASDRRTEELESDRRLLDGLINTIRSGSADQVQSLLYLIRTDATRTDLLSHLDALRPGESGAGESSAPAVEQPVFPPQEERRASQTSSSTSRARIHDLLNHDQAN